MSRIVAAEMAVSCIGGEELPGWAALVGEGWLDVGELNTHVDSLVKTNQICEGLPGNWCCRWKKATSVIFLGGILAQFNLERDSEYKGWMPFS
jgi:hypothetical protein